MAETEAVYYRFPPGLRDQLKDAAARAGRSANEEVVTRLIASLSTVGNGQIASLAGAARPDPR